MGQPLPELCFGCLGLRYNALSLGCSVWCSDMVYPFRTGTGKAFSNYKRKQTRSGNTKILFDDIGGQEVAKRELLEALEFIVDSEHSRKLGIRPLKGILLTGPPVGKTLLAKAAASHTDNVFVAASGSEFIEMYAGVGAQRVRKLFSTARSSALRENRDSAMIFIDEIEVLGGKREDIPVTLNMIRLLTNYLSKWMA